MKKMKNKGFTLIELLAIIVILAIIAVITVPLILGIIDEAKSKSAVSSVVGYGKAVELAYSHYQLGTDSTLVKPITGTGAVTSNELNSGAWIKLTVGSDVIAIRVDFSGDKVVCDTTGATNTVANGKLTLQGCKINGNNSPTYLYDNGRGCTTPGSGTTCP